MRTGKPGTSSFVIAIICLGLTACNRTQSVPVAQDQAQTGDPSNGNLAPADQYAQTQPVAGAPPQQAYSQPASSQAYSQPAYSQPAPNNAPSYPADNNQNYSPPANYPSDTYDAAPGGYDTGSNAQYVYATEPPPPIPEYSQPPCPGDNYFWNPGYWNYADSGYYWVPGAWVIAPYVGALWTPPYWGYRQNRYVFNVGYWGPTIGFYGGINYGFGYTGRGYYGAYWNHGQVYYNRSVTNVNVNIVHNVYNYNAPVVTSTRVSYDGGRGGLNVRPTPSELAVLRQPRVPPVAAQVQHANQAASNREQFAAVNRGRPQTLAAATPLPTSYRAPAARPPANVIPPAAPRPAPDTRAQVQPAPRPGLPENRAFENRAPQTRPPAPQEFQRPGAPPAPVAAQPARPENRTLPQQVSPQQVPPQQAQRPDNRAIPAARPAIPENRPAPQQPQRNEGRPAFESRAAPAQPAARPAPPPQPAARPVPEARSAPQPVARPAPPPPPQPAARPVPEARPAPQPAARPAPPPQPAARPVPEARPTPQPAARPAPPPPQARPAPPPAQARPAPPPPQARPSRAEERKDK